MAQVLTGKNLRTSAALATQKLVDFYEGDQLKYLVKDLNKYRKNWKKRTIIPRVRNVTKSIADKSGLLFNQPPALEIVPSQGAAPVIDPTFNQLMERSDWIEFFQNVDVYTRLTKSTVLLQQKYIATDTTTQDGSYVPDFDKGDALLLTLLTRANADVVMDITGTIIIEVAYLTSDICNGKFTYRDITPTEITDWEVNGTVEKKVDSAPNPDGFVAANFFYDVNKPVNGGWANPPEDIVALQEMVNLAITDTDFAMAHQKHKTLFTNARVENSTAAGTPIMPRTEEGFNTGNKGFRDPDLGTTNSLENMGGLGTVTTLTAPDGAEQPFLKFDGPVSDLDKLNNVLDQLMVGVAFDWSVSLRNDGNGRANSGFQIIVEEKDNLQLRDKRAQSMQAGMRRFYDICRKLYPTLKQGMLRVKFAPPTLPVDTMEQEQLWDLKIGGGRATVYDYLRQVDGLDDAAAMEKIQEIQRINALLGFSPALTAKAQATGTFAAAPPAAAGGTNPVGTV